MTRIKGALFDKDGTLIDFMASWRDLTRGAILHFTGHDETLARRIGAAIGFDFASGRFQPGSPAVAGSTGEVAGIIAEFLPALTAGEIAAGLNARAAEVGVVAAPGLSESLTRLREMGLTLGVATHDSERAARTHVKALGVAEMFSFIAGYDSGYGHKPGPGMVNAFCASAGLKPEEVVMIGDSVHDLGAGRSAGAAASVGVLTGPAGEADLAPLADVVLPGVADLPDWLISAFPAQRG